MRFACGAVGIPVRPEWIPAGNNKKAVLEVSFLCVCINNVYPAFKVVQSSEFREFPGAINQAIPNHLFTSSPFSSYTQHDAGTPIKQKAAKSADAYTYYIIYMGCCRACGIFNGIIIFFRHWVIIFFFFY